FPYTVVEAMACGRPTVCTNVGGVSEAVGDTGFVVPPRDYAAVAEAGLKRLRDDELRRRLGVLARARVLEHFTLRRSLEMYRNVYEGLATPVEASPEPKHLRSQFSGRATPVPVPLPLPPSSQFQGRAAIPLRSAV